MTEPLFFESRLDQRLRKADKPRFKSLSVGDDDSGQVSGYPPSDYSLGACRLDGSNYIKGLFTMGPFTFPGTIPDTIFSVDLNGTPVNVFKSEWNGGLGKFVALVLAQFDGAINVDGTGTFNDTTTFNDVATHNARIDGSVLRGLASSWTVQNATGGNIITMAEAAGIAYETIGRNDAAVTAASLGFRAGGATGNAGLNYVPATGLQNSVEGTAVWNAKSTQFESLLPLYLYSAGGQEVILTADNTYQLTTTTNNNITKPRTGIMSVRTLDNDGVGGTTQYNHIYNYDAALAKTFNTYSLAAQAYARGVSVGGVFTPDWITDGSIHTTAKNISMTGTPSAATHVVTKAITDLLDGRLDVFDEVNAARHEATGFADESKAEILFVDGTQTFTVQPKAPATEFVIYQSNVKYTISAPQSIVMGASEGTHYFYFDAGVLTHATTFTDALILEYVFIAYLYWDATNTQRIRFANEKHGITMDGRTHLFLHQSIGTTYRSGLALTGLLVDQSGDLDTHAQFTCDDGVILDEDIRHTISDGSPQVLDPLNGPIYYLDGAAPVWRMTAASNFGVHPYPTAVDRPAYNQNVLGTWQLTTVPTGDFVLCHLFATGDVDYPIMKIMGQAFYPNQGTAREGATTEINNLVFGPLGELLPEFKPIGTVIYQTRNTYANSVKARIRSTDSGEDYVDWRFSSLSPSAVSASDHNTLTNLQVDSHFIYALLAGRTGDVLHMDNMTDVAGTGPVNFQNGASLSVEGTDDSHVVTKAYVDSIPNNEFPIIRSSLSDVKQVTDSIADVPVYSSTTTSVDLGYTGSRTVLLNGRAYMVDAYVGFYIFDVLDFSSVSLIESVADFNCGWAIAVYENALYVGKFGAGLDVYDNTRPYELGAAVTTLTDGSVYADGLFIYNGYMFACAINVYIYDLTDPLAPTLTSTIVPTSGPLTTPYNCEAYGNYAYLAIYGAGLEIWNISTIGTPAYVNSYAAGNAQYVTVQQIGAVVYAYLCVRLTGVLVLDVTNPASISLITTLVHSGPGGADVTLVDGTYYLGVADYTAGVLTIYSLATPASPLSIKTISLSGVGDIVFDDRDIYAAAFPSNSRIYRFEQNIEINDTIFEEDGQVTLGAEGTSSGQLITKGYVDGPSLFEHPRIREIVGKNRMELDNITTVVDPTEVVGYATMWYPLTGTYVYGGYLYAIHLGLGFGVFDLLDWTTGDIISRVTDANADTGISVYMDAIYVSMQTVGLQVYDNAHPSSLSATPLTTLTDSANYNGRHLIHSAFLYVIDNAGVIYVYDLTVPQAPTLATTITMTAGTAIDMGAIGNTLYVAAAGYGVEMWNITTPATAALINRFPANGTSDVTCIEVITIGAIDYAYVGSTTSGIEVWDVTTPAAPVYQSTTALSNIVDIDSQDIGGTYHLATANGANWSVWTLATPTAPATTINLVATNANGCRWNEQNLICTSSTIASRLYRFSGLMTVENGLTVNDGLIADKVNIMDDANNLLVIEQENGVSTTRTAATILLKTGAAPTNDELSVVFQSTNADDYAAMIYKMDEDAYDDFVTPGSETGVLSIESHAESNADSVAVKAGNMIFDNVMNIVKLGNGSEVVEKVVRSNGTLAAPTDVVTDDVLSQKEADARVGGAYDTSYKKVIKADVVASSYVQVSKSETMYDDYGVYQEAYIKDAGGRLHKKNHPTSFGASSSDQDSGAYLIVGVPTGPNISSAVWQSFTAGVTGQMDRYRIYYYMTSNDIITSHNLTYIVYEGDGAGGEVLLTDVDTTAWSFTTGGTPSSFTHTFSSAVNVIAGRQYTVSIQYTGIDAHIRQLAYALAPYAGGQCSAGGDLAFITYVQPVTAVTEVPFANIGDNNNLEYTNLTTIRTNTYQKPTTIETRQSNGFYGSEAVTTTSDILRDDRVKGYASSAYQDVIQVEDSATAVSGANITGKRVVKINDGTGMVEILTIEGDTVTVNDTLNVDNINEATADAGILLEDGSMFIKDKNAEFRSDSISNGYVRLYKNGSTSTPGYYLVNRSRGTYASPTQVSSADSLSLFVIGGRVYRNGAYRDACNFSANVETGGGTSNPPTNWNISNNSGGGWIAAVTGESSGILSFENQSHAHVTLSGSQSISTTGYVKIQFNSEVRDKQSEYDPSTNYRFTPKVAGVYELKMHYRIAVGSDYTRSHAAIGVYNGSSMTYYDGCAAALAGTSAEEIAVASISPYLASTSYYVEFYVYVVAGGSNVGSLQTSSYATVAKIA